jgi:hypothetical protein
MQLPPGVTVIGDMSEMEVATDGPKVSNYLAAGSPTRCFLPSCRKPLGARCVHGKDGHYYCSEACTAAARTADFSHVEELRPQARAALPSPKQKIAISRSAANLVRCGHHLEEAFMAKKRKQTARGRKQDRARVAGGQDYEVRYEAKKTGKSAKKVKRAVKRVGNSRKKVERRLGK